MGNPEGLNLRNIIWHGFASPHEIHSSYAAILFILIASFGDILRNNNLLTSIMHRPLINKSIQQQFIAISKNITYNFKKDLINIIKLSKCVPIQFKTYWTCILKHYECKQWSDCTLLIIPQLENIFRYIFCSINKQNQRLLTADNKTLYTTLDDIFDETNGLYDIYNNNYLSLIHDVFVYISGPRLRDKLSHGEVDFKALDQNVVNVLLIILLYGISKFENYKTPECLKQIEYYKCLYHKNAIFLKHVQDLLMLIESLNNIQVPHEFVIENIWTDFTKTIQQIQVVVFKRPKHEKEFINLMNQILENFCMASKNLKESLDLKYAAFMERKLRSKRRLTYQQLLKFLPDFCKAVMHFIKFLMNVFDFMQNKDLADFKLLK